MAQGTRYQTRNSGPGDELGTKNGDDGDEMDSDDNEPDSDDEETSVDSGNSETVSEAEDGDDDPG